MANEDSPINAFVLPARGFVLQPSFRIKEVVIVERADYGGYLISDSGKVYRGVEVYGTKLAAIEGGRKVLEAQQADLDKRQARLTKRRETLEKSAAKELRSKSDS